MASSRTRSWHSRRCASASSTASRRAIPNRGYANPGCKIQIFSFPFYTLSPEYQIIANFSELVLLCIEADFCTQIRIFQHFSRSTRFSHFCTAFICKIRFKHRSKFCKNCTFFVNFHYFCSKSTFFAPILMNFSRNFTDFQYSRVDIR